MVDVFYDPVDGAGKFIPLIQLLQVPEVIAVLVESERVLDVARYCAVNVFIRTGLGNEGG